MRARGLVFCLVTNDPKRGFERDPPKRIWCQRCNNHYPTQALSRARAEAAA